MNYEKSFISQLSEEAMFVHSGTIREDPHHPVSFPIYQTSTFENKDLLKKCNYSYTRCKNPTRNALEFSVAQAEKGEYCCAFSSGLSAILAVFSLLSSGDHVILSEDIYGGTFRLMKVIFARFGVKCTLADFSNADSIREAVCEKTRLLFCETPTNPMCRVCDITECAEIAHEIGAKLCVDNTFLTPYFQKPLCLGADIVVHSGTKYLCGHNDTMAGFVITNDRQTAENFEYISSTEGTALSPFDCWLVMRGMKTLELRMKRHEENAKRVCEWLLHNRNVDSVYYAGIPGTKAYEIMQKQARGFGAVISFRLKYASLIDSVLTGGKTIIFAESLGGVESLVTHPITQTHKTTPQQLREKLGIDERLIRLSCGIEPSEDIIRDLEVSLGKNL